MSEKPNLHEDSAFITALDVAMNDNAFPVLTMYGDVKREFELWEARYAERFPEAESPVEWAKAAVKEGAMQGVRKPKYVTAILNSWLDAGKIGGNGDRRTGGPERLPAATRRDGGVPQWAIDASKRHDEIAEHRLLETGRGGEDGVGTGRGEGDGSEREPQSREPVPRL